MNSAEMAMELPPWSVNGGVDYTANTYPEISDSMRISPSKPRVSVSTTEGSPVQTPRSTKRRRTGVQHKHNSGPNGGFTETPKTPTLTPSTPTLTPATPTHITFATTSATDTATTAATTTTTTAATPTTTATTSHTSTTSTTGNSAQQSNRPRLSGGFSLGDLDALNQPTTTYEKQIRCKECNWRTLVSLKRWDDRLPNCMKCGTSLRETYEFKESDTKFPLDPQIEALLQSVKDDSLHYVKEYQHMYDLDHKSEKLGDFLAFLTLFGDRDMTPKIQKRFNEFGLG